MRTVDVYGEWLLQERCASPERCAPVSRSLRFSARPPAASEAALPSRRGPSSVHTDGRKLHFAVRPQSPVDSLLLHRRDARDPLGLVCVPAARRDEERGKERRRSTPRTSPPWWCSGASGLLLPSSRKEMLGEAIRAGTTTPFPSIVNPPPLLNVIIYHLHYSCR